MDINKLLYEIAKEKSLGEIIENPTRLKGGLTHKMYKIVTNKNAYVIKLLNPNIMKRPTAITNFNRAEKYEKVLEENNIPAIYALEFEGHKRQLKNKQYYYIYRWYEGKTLQDDELTIKNCTKIGQVLARIHNISLEEFAWQEQPKAIDFNYYIELANEKNSIIYEYLKDKINILNEILQRGNDSINKLPKYRAICHNDLDSKNVLWEKEDFKIIDLECLDYNNPYLEVFSLALYWSGYDSCNINLQLFANFIKSYFKQSKLTINIDWESIYYANNSQLDWLEFNIKRSLLLVTDSKEEQELGIRETKDTIKRLVYYLDIKEKILQEINNLKTIF